MEKLIADDKFDFSYKDDIVNKEYFIGENDYEEENKLFDLLKKKSTKEIVFDNSSADSDSGIYNLGKYKDLPKKPFKETYANNISKSLKKLALSNSSLSSTPRNRPIINLINDLSQENIVLPTTMVENVNEKTLSDSHDSNCNESRNLNPKHYKGYHKLKRYKLSLFNPIHKLISKSPSFNVDNSNEQDRSNLEAKKNEKSFT